jgi:spore germination protein GerM
MSSVLLLAAGCNPGEAGKDREENGGTIEDDATEEVAVQLFFSEPGAVNTGTPGEYGFVAPVTRMLPAGEGLLHKALEELIRGPRPEDGDYGKTVPETARILDLSVEGKVAVVDLSGAVLTDSPGGTLGGSIFMQSMVYTATQFPEVEKVQVLVDGEPWCDGHFIWEDPLGPEDLF